MAYLCQLQEDSHKAAIKVLARVSSEGSTREGPNSKLMWSLTVFSFCLTVGQPSVPCHVGLFIMASCFIEVSKGDS